MALSPDQIPQTIDDKYPGLVEASKGHGMTFIDGKPHYFVIDNPQIPPSQTAIRQAIDRWGSTYPDVAPAVRHLGSSATGEPILMVPTELAGGHDAHNNVGGHHPEYQAIAEASGYAA